MIVRDEEKGKVRAEYAKETVKNLSNHLNKEFGNGYSVDNLQWMLKFYLAFQKYEPVVRILDSSQIEIHEPLVRKSRMPDKN